jgi:uncharacterized protein YceH (UPF0502 family)
MSGDTLSPTASAWPVLSLHERRVLGVMVEKAKTTPDAYPLSINALVAGCNQKSNRDPLLDLTEDDAEQALVDCQKKGLAIKITGGRVERWRHNLYDAWKVEKVELAVLAELLLRGPQTEGELRGRASRMEPIDDVEALRPTLRRLAERGLVVYLTPEGRRGTTLSHGFHGPEELERLRSKHGSGFDAEESGAPSSRPAPAPAADWQAELAALRTQLGELQATVSDLAGQLKALKESLGA